MPDEKNAAVNDAGADDDRAHAEVNDDAVGRTPPPLVPPPVRRDGEEIDPVQARVVTEGRPDSEPLFVEPVVDWDDAARADPTPDSSADDTDVVEGPVGRDLIEDRPHDPVEPGERRLDPAPQSLAASPIPTVDPPLLTDGGDRRDGESAPAATALAARDDQSADAETVAVSHPSTSPSAPPQPLLVPPTEGGVEQTERGVQQTAAYPSAPGAPPRQFIQPPVPPKKKGNRAIGSIIALLSVILFAALYLAIAALVLAINTSGDALGSTIGRFVAMPIFWVPAILFVIAFVLVVLLANRAGWWAYVLGSLLVGAIVYFGAIGIQLVVEGVFGLTPGEAQDRFELYALNPFVIAAGLVAREVSLWTGSAISARGRRMKARNVTAREDFERASAEHRAAYERPGY